MAVDKTIQDEGAAQNRESWENVRREQDMGLKFTHTHTQPQDVHFFESSFRGMVIHGRDYKQHSYKWNVP